MIKYETLEQLQIIKAILKNTQILIFMRHKFLIHILNLIDEMQVLAERMRLNCSHARNTVTIEKHLHSMRVFNASLRNSWITACTQ